MPNDNNERALTPAEQRRKQAFDKLTRELTEQGYRQTDLTVSPKSANVKGMGYGLLLALPFVILYFVIYRRGGFSADKNIFIKYLFFIVLLLALAVVHELIHGFFWGLYSKGRFKSIEFGILWKSLNPYCTCSEPLTKKQYLIGSLMPCLLLGILPCVLAIVLHSGWLLFLGVMMTAAAGGDILVSLVLLRHKCGGEVLYYDHPTAIGLVAFCKD